MARNISELIDPTRRAGTEITLLTPAQTHSLIGTLATSPHECLIVTSLATGLRQSEQCGLWGSDIDLESGTLTVRAQLERGGMRRVDPKQGSRRIQRVLANAGLPKVRFHALRHAFATTLLADGEDLASVSKLLAHRGLATTANVCGHLTDRARRRAADRMDRALRQA